MILAAELWGFFGPFFTINSLMGYALASCVCAFLSATSIWNLLEAQHRREVRDNEASLRDYGPGVKAFIVVSIIQGLLWPIVLTRTLLK